MTTDTAVRVTRIVVQDKGITSNAPIRMIFVRQILIQYITMIVPLEQIPWSDYPELHINKHESTEMPFRYVKGDDGKPVMPEVSPPPLIPP